MRLVRACHRAILRVQDRRWARVLLSVLWTGAVLAAVIPVLLASSRLHTDRSAIFDLLSGEDQRIVGEVLAETGFIEFDGRRIGDERLRGLPVLDEAGRVSDPATLTWLLVQSEIPSWLPRWLLRSTGTTWLVAAATLAWGLMATWLGLLPIAIYAGFGTLLCWATLRWLGADGLALAVVGTGVLAYTFALMLRLMRLLVSSPRQVPAVAGGLLMEAARTRLSLAFITVLLVVLPLIPFWLDPASPLRHRVQTMISRGLGATFAIAACLTVLLACATVAFEIRDRQIWQVVTKPVGRGRYLLGKWLGLVALNGSILAVACLGIFIYLQYLRMQPVASGMQGELDRLAVDEEVLTARVSASPKFELLTGEQLDARVTTLIEADPEVRGNEDLALPLRRRIRNEMQDQYLASQRSIPPMQQGDSFHRTYEFDGLGLARRMGAPIAIRYRFFIRDSSEHDTFRVGFVYNEDPATRQVSTYVPTMTHVTLIPASFIGEDGVLRVSVFNLYQPPPHLAGRGALSFDPGGLELLYRAGDFEPNFLRAVLVLWVKLAFLAALGLAAATFLSFPVACLATFTIFASGTLAPWLAESLELYVPPATASVDFGSVGQVIQWAFENVIRGIASLLVFVLEGFGNYQPTQRLVQGLLVPWGAVMRGGLVIGVLWSGAALLAGTLVLRRRQLAIYSGGG